MYERSVMIQKIVLSLCVLALIHSTFIKAMSEESADLNALLLGVREDMVDPEYIANLLAQGAQIDARDAAGKTALMKFAARSWWPECKLLITHSQFYPSGTHNPNREIEHASLETIRQLLQTGLRDQETTIALLTKRKIELLKPLMREAMQLARDKDMIALLNPDIVEQNYAKEIRENIRKELQLQSSGLFSWCSIQ